MEKTKIRRKTIKTKTKTKKMSGGKEEVIEWDYGGTSITDLPSDIIGVIVHTINTIINTVAVVDNVIALPANMGTAFSSPTEPSPDDVDITGM